VGNKGFYSKMFVFHVSLSVTTHSCIGNGTNS